MARSTLCTFVCCLLCCCTLYAKDLSPRWLLQGAPKITIQKNYINEVALSIIDRERRKPFTIKFDTVINSVYDYFIYKNDLVLLGNAGKSQAVEVFNLSAGKKSDWFFCYEPRRAGGSWLFYVEWYPAHSTATPTDVVLAYDLSKSPNENRLAPAIDIPPGRFDRPVAVGIPIFPEFNYKHKTYLNSVASVSDAVSVLGPPFFLMLTSKRLLFISNRGVYPNLSQHLIVIDLSHGIEQATFESEAIPHDDIIPGKNNSGYIRVNSMSPLGPFEVRLNLPPGEYGSNAILMKIRK